MRTTTCIYHSQRWNDLVETGWRTSVVRVISGERIAFMVRED
jgi:hypothetical protein